MGFRKGSYARVWEVQPVSDTNTKIRITISRKDKLTGEYISKKETGLSLVMSM